MSSKGHERILVVDDNEINRKVLSVRLREEGYTVEEASGGKEALDLLGQSVFNLVLLDVMMPDINGLEVLRSVRESRSVAELPVIMATARTDSADIVEALALGANDYVTKPIDFPVLFARVKTNLRLQSLAQEKDDFIRIASHDLKNPLAIVRSSLEIVKACVPSGTPMPDDIPEVLDRAVRHTLTMERLISDFLDFQALEDGSLSIRQDPFTLELVASAAIDLLTDYTRSKNIRIHFQPESPAATVIGDKQRIQQVILNLVGNSIRFSPAETTVHVRITHEPDAVRLAVSDEGPGLTEDDLARLFTKYVRLSNQPTHSEKSSGLGLAICSKLIAAHNGSIGAENNAAGRGATFWFKLPRSQG